MKDIIEQRYLEWKQNDAVEELSSDEVVDCFYRELEFGTGGLRGKIGQGTNRMNFFTVGRATFGLAEYLINNYENPSVAIAYDSRRFSKEFAKLSASIMSYKGIEVFLFNQLMPTPVLSYTVRKLKTSAGIVITASHNPKEYNGYKVYNEKGCQITDSTAKEITEHIDKFGYFNEYKANNELIRYVNEEILNDYINEVYSYGIYDVKTEYQPLIVYTPLCGTGRLPSKKLFEKMGIKVNFVKEQEMPDENFTTCPYPNPEEDGALKLAFEYAKEKKAELILATDPDADRLGVAERLSNGEIRRFSGNEVGLILLDFVLNNKQKNNQIPKNATVVKTIVTSDLGEKIANNYGVKIRNVLTGFKYIGEQIDLLEKESDFLFGFEESCGYLIGSFARDKDSIGALMLVIQAKAFYKEQGKTLTEALDGIYKKYGYSSTHLQSILYEGQDGAIKKDAVISKLRKNPITEICGKKVNVFNDYINGLNGLPKSNVMEFIGDDFKFIIRPSGTEPKLKIYYFASGLTQVDADMNLKCLREDVSKLL